MDTTNAAIKGNWRELNNPESAPFLNKMYETGGPKEKE